MRVGKTILLMFVCVLSGCAHQSTNEKSDYAHYAIFPLVTNIDKLHKLKIGEVPELEKTLETQLSIDAKLLHYLANHETIKPNDAKRINEMLRLLSVMNEKFEIEAWRTDAELQSVFEKAQKQNPDHVNKLRCLDWSKGMWVGKNKSC